MKERFKSIPSIVGLDSLVVSGDVWFGSGVTLKVSQILLDQNCSIVLKSSRTSKSGEKKGTVLTNVCLCISVFLRGMSVSTLDWV